MDGLSLYLYFCLSEINKCRDSKVKHPKTYFRNILFVVFVCVRARARAHTHTHTHTKQAAYFTDMPYLYSPVTDDNETGYTPTGSIIISMYGFNSPFCARIKIGDGRPSNGKHRQCKCNLCCLSYLTCLSSVLFTTLS